MNQLSFEFPPRITICNLKGLCMTLVVNSQLKEETLMPSCTFGALFALSQSLTSRFFYFKQVLEGGMSVFQRSFPPLSGIYNVQVLLIFTMLLQNIKNFITSKNNESKLVQCKVTWAIYWHHRLSEELILGRCQTLPASDWIKDFIL